MHPLVEYVEYVDVWAATIEDRPGHLAHLLAELREAGADLQFIIARRAEPLSYPLISININDFS